MMMPNKLSNMYAIVAIVAIATITGCEDVEENARKNKGAAENVVRAIESYRVKNGGYPEKLDSLVPVMMPELPKLSGNVRWEYIRRGPDSFVVAYVGYSSDWTGGYSSRDGGWYLDTK